MMTELKQTEYTTIEIGEGGDYGSVIGNIVFDKSKMLYAEIVSGTICDHGELVNARAFLDEVEDAMTTNTSNVSNAETTPIINEECVGCCKVVDIAAKLQEELEDTEIKLVGCRKLIDDRDRTIRELSAMVDAKTKANQAIVHDKNTIIEELKDKNIEDLHELYDLDKEEIDRMEKVHANRKAHIHNLSSTVKSLEAELSARKKDSAVLKKVVDVIEDDNIPNLSIPCIICSIVDDYLGAPEVHGDVDGGNTSCTVEMDIRCE